MNNTIEILSKAVSCTIEGAFSSKRSIHYLLTDSRSLSFPEETVFFALVSERNDGHQYIETLYERGVRAFVVSNNGEWGKKFPLATFLRVNNTLDALQAIAKQHRSRFHIPIIGITGSNGKTVIKEWISCILEKHLHITRSPRSYNSQIGVPLSIWQLTNQTELGVFEAGISKPNEMQHLQSIIRPTIGIFTNLGEAHQIGFGSLKEKCNEKLELFLKCETLIYCIDHAIIHDCINLKQIKANLFTWSRAHHHCPTLLVQSVTKTTSTTTIQFVYRNRQNEITIPAVDEGSIENAIHCLCAILALNIDFLTIKDQFQQLPMLSMRLEVSEGKQGNLLINDSYNSDINSLTIAIDFLNRRAATGKQTKTIILSDMSVAQISKDSRYTEIANMLQFHKIDHLIGVGDELFKHQLLFDTPRKEFYRTTRELINSGDLLKLQNEIILLKGRRTFEFEQISRILSQKVHQTTLEVNLEAIAHNLNYYRSLLNPTTKIICMVKAFGYGLGSYEIAKTLQENRCDYLAVAVADEGVELRNAGIILPIMVMNPEKNSFEELFRYNLEPEIYSLKLLNELIQAAKREGITNFPIHLKIDTGMNRLGFKETDLDQAILLFQQNSCIRIRSCFSHLVGSDQSSHDTFTQQQFDRFEKSLHTLHKKLDKNIKAHILNTAGIERFATHQYDMVRLGIGLYGVSGSDKPTDLKCCSSLKTVILQIHSVHSGETIGYGRNGIAQKESQIATIPIGYADGLNRRLSNGKGKVYVNGIQVSIIGNICMDTCMIDITDIEAKEGDEVEIFGPQQSIQEVATSLETIPYEVLTSISSRVKRLYFRE